MQSKNQVVTLAISVFEKPEQTVQSNHSANALEKKKLPSYFAGSAWTSKFILYFSKNEVAPLEVSIFQKSARRRCQKFQLTKIEKRPLYTLSLPSRLQTFIMAYTMLAYSAQK